MFSDGEAQFAECFEEFRMDGPREDSQSHIGNIRSGKTDGHDRNTLRTEQITDYATAVYVIKWGVSNEELPEWKNGKETIQTRGIPQLVGKSGDRVFRKCDISPQTVCTRPRDRYHFRSQTLR